MQRMQRISRDQEKDRIREFQRKEATLRMAENTDKLYGKIKPL